mgnify:CR=1 FL=1
MARDEVDEVEETSEVKDKKYFTATLSKVDDAELIEKVGRLQRIGGFSMKEIFVDGVESIRKSEKYQKAIREISEEAE